MRELFSFKKFMTLALTAGMPGSSVYADVLDSYVKQLKDINTAVLCYNLGTVEQNVTAMNRALIALNKSMRVRATSVGVSGDGSERHVVINKKGERFDGGIQNKLCVVLQRQS